MICIEDKVFLNNEITSSAKMFYGWLKNNGSELDKSNIHYAVKFDVSTMTINNWLFSLEQQGLIEIFYYKRKRKISIIN